MPNNNFIYTNHAIKKIGFYGLEKWQIEKVLLEPDKMADRKGSFRTRQGSSSQCHQSQKIMLK